MNFRLLKTHLESDNLADILCEQFKQLDIGLWQLNKDAMHSGMFDEDSLQFSILNTEFKNNQVTIKTGIYISEAITPCPCAGEEVAYSELYCQRTITLDMLHQNFSIEQDRN